MNVTNSIFRANEGKAPCRELSQSCFCSSLLLINTLRTFGHPCTAGSPNANDNGFGAGLFMNGGCTDGCLVDGNTFISNQAPKGDGGGFYAAAPATMVVSNNKFTNNFAGAAPVDLQEQSQFGQHSLALA